MAPTTINRLRDKLLHPERDWWSIGNVLVVAGLLRLGSVALLRSFLHPHMYEFGQLAKNLVGGLGYSNLFRNGTCQPSIYMPPGYAYFLVPFFRVGGQRPLTLLVVEIIQAAIGVLLVYVVYRLALILIGKSGATVAACLAAIYPTLVYICNEFHPINLYIVLEAAAVFFLVRYLQVSESWKDVLLAGMCMGSLMFFRGETPALTLLYAILLLLRGGTKAVKPALVFVLIACACIAPWTIRNYRIFGRVVPICASDGVNLWIGNNPQATGDDRYTATNIVREDFMRGEVPPSNFEQLPPDIKEAFSPIPMDQNSQITKNNVLKDLAINFIRTHPREEALLAMKKIFAFFIFDRRHPKGRSPAYWVPSILLSLLALWGAVRRGKKILAQDLFLVGSIMFAVAVGVAVFVLPRFKVVIDPFIIIFAANGLYGLFAIKI
jgi:hypothetical protein